MWNKLSWDLLTKRSTIPVALFLIAVSVCTAWIARGAAGETRRPISRHKLEWRASLDAAHEEAVRTKKPMLLIIDSDDCKFSRKMHQTTLKDQGIVWSINRSFIPVRLDIRQNIEIARKLEIKRIPATIALSPHADLLGGLIGFAENAQYREMLFNVKKLNDQISR
jgi:thioredoxin-related protein